MKVYYFLNNLLKEDYNFFLNKVFLVKGVSDIDNIISKYYHKIWEKNELRTQKAAFMEAFMFLKVYLKEKKWDIWDIEWVYKKNFLINNEDFYEENNYEWSKVVWDIWLVTSRDSFNNSFFNYFKKLSEFNSRYKIFKIHFWKSFLFEDKINFLSKILENRKKYIWQIIIPFIMKKEVKDIYFLLLFINNNLWKKFILKNSIWATWNNIKAIDFKDTWIDSKELYWIKEKFFYWNIYNHVSPYFTEFYDIKIEFRFYYTYSNGEIYIYSIKNRINKVKWDWNIFLKEDFSYSNISTIWKYLDLNLFFINYKYIYDEISIIIKKQWIWSGVLELCELNNGELRFIEINSLWWTLMYPWDDEVNMKKYYCNIWKNIIS